MPDQSNLTATELAWLALAEREFSTPDDDWALLKAVPSLIAALADARGERDEASKEAEHEAEQADRYRRERDYYADAVCLTDDMRITMLQGGGSARSIATAKVGEVIHRMRSAEKRLASLTPSAEIVKEATREKAEPYDPRTEMLARELLRIAEVAEETGA